MSYSRDSSNAALKSFDQFNLEILENNTSIYYSANKQKGLQRFKEDSKKNDYNVLINNAGTYYNDAESEIVFFNSNTKTFDIFDFLGYHAYKTTDTLGIPNWELHSDTMNYLTMTCQKATTNFRGRNYTAWFAVEIPFSFGPWKLNNLPGLILKVTDDKNYFSITATELTKDLSNKPLLSVYEQPTKIKFSKLKQLKKIKISNPALFDKMEWPDVNITTSKGDVQRKVTLKPYNPLDLTSE